MKTTSLHIAFAALLSLLLLASCSRNDEVAVAEGEEGKVYVTLTLSINGEEAGSRATWDPEQVTDEEGVGWENEIDDLQILIYDENDAYAGTVEGLFGSNDRYIGTLSGTDWQSGTYKFVVLANFTAANTDLAGLASITYNQNTDYIPMFGVTKGEFTFEAGENTNIGSIDLLRAMAKVEVNFSDDFPTDEYTIEDITISPYNAQGYCVPTGYASVETTGELDREEETPASFNPLSSSPTNPLTFTEENGKHYIYLPEYENTETSAAKIKVTVNGETYDLEFKDYENGAPKEGTQYNIVRNHIYRYTITGVNDGELKLEYRVLLWDKVESAIGWNPEIQDGGNAPVAAWPSKFNSDKEADPDFEYATNGDQEAVFCYLLAPRYTNSDHKSLEYNRAYAGFYFHLTEPEGAIWEAYLTNTEDFKLNESGAHDSDGDKVTDSYCAVRGRARQKPYQIQVTVQDEHYWTEPRYEGDNQFWDNLSSWGKDIEESGYCKNIYTDLYIRISIDGGYTWNWLDINKEDDYIKSSYWGKRRFAGGDKFIRIWQLKALKDVRHLGTIIKRLDADWGIKDFWNPTDNLEIPD